MVGSKLVSVLAWSVGVSIRSAANLVGLTLSGRNALSPSGVIVSLVSFFLGALLMSSGILYFVEGVVTSDVGGRVGLATHLDGVRGMVFLGAK